MYHSCDYGVTNMQDQTVQTVATEDMWFFRFHFHPVNYRKTLLMCSVLQASYDVNNFGHVTSILKANDGEKGGNKDCHGKNAQHSIVKVPVGTIVKSNIGRVVGDLNKEGTMFVAARGGAGGKGNHFFITDLDHAPKVCEIGAAGEDISYLIELRSMAHVGLVNLKYSMLKIE